VTRTQPELFGRSVEGRALELHHAGPSGPLHLLLFGGIHGDEPGSVELCEAFVRGGSAARPTVVVPAVNPDGLLRGTKDNARGVDLNRNFPAKSWSREHPPGYDPGPAPLSEPESAALARLIDELSPQVIVSVHQPFRCVNWDGPAGELARQMSEACGYPAVASVGYPTPGSFGSRYGVDRGLPVITLELPRPVPDEDRGGCLRALECAMLFSAR
jgi:protein MpaA